MALYWIRQSIFIVNNFTYWCYQSLIVIKVSKVLSLKNIEKCAYVEQTRLFVPRKQRLYIQLPQQIMHRRWYLADVQKLAHQSSRLHVRRWRNCTRTRSRAYRKCECTVCIIHGSRRGFVIDGREKSGNAKSLEKRCRGARRIALDGLVLVHWTGLVNSLALAFVPLFRETTSRPDEFTCVKREIGHPRLSIAGFLFHSMTGSSLRSYAGRRIKSTSMISGPWLLPSSCVDVRVCDASCNVRQERLK